VSGGGLWVSLSMIGRPWRPWLPGTEMFPPQVTYDRARQIALETYKIPGMTDGIQRVLHDESASIVTGIGATEIEASVNVLWGQIRFVLLPSCVGGWIGTRIRACGSCNAQVRLEPDVGQGVTPAGGFSSGCVGGVRFSA
jgi:hypothetical protein